MITQRTHANLPPADMLWCSATEGCCILSRDEVARARRGIRAIEEDRACLRANMLCGGAHRPLKRQGVDRKRVGEGRSGSVSGECGGRRIIKKKQTTLHITH